VENTGIRPMSASRRTAHMAVLLAASLGISVVERAIPMPMPFVHVGLANIVTVYAIITMGLADAVAIVLMRVVLVSLVSGTFPGPAFSLSLGGGAAAVLAMGAAHRGAPPLGVVGISLVGALFHNLGQLAVVAALFTGAGPALRLVPLATLMAAGAGLVTGIIALLVIERLGHLGFPGVTERLEGRA
jgi:heptaprenyl diphosphate synthase